MRLFPLQGAREKGQAGEGEPGEGFGTIGQDDGRLHGHRSAGNVFGFRSAAKLEVRRKHRPAQQHARQLVNGKSLDAVKLLGSLACL